MPEQITNIQVFLSSPGDVPQERQMALEVLEVLPNRPSLRGKVTFSIVAWDKLGAGTPMLASKSPQEAINEGLSKPSECDIVVVILWSRMGTPFIYNGVEYSSGTHYELLDALSNPETETIIYHRTEKKQFDFDDDKGIAQYKKVQNFFKSDLFYDSTSEHIQRGVNNYANPAEFKAKLEYDLESLTLKLLKRSPVSATVDSAAEKPTYTSTIWKGSPFPGLRSFKKEDAPIFFGREAETDALVRKVAESRFVAVVGASGSGKSSLVGAGLLPSLEAPAIPGSKDWRVVQFKPGKVPFDALFEAFLKTFERLRPHPIDLPDKKRAFIENVQREPTTLGEILNAALESVKAPEWAEVLLFIDQFEELFTQSQQEVVEAFTGMLSKLAAHPRMRVVVTIRHDFVPRAIELSELAKLLNKGAFYLSAPTPSALSQMIERPAEMAALEFERGLPTLILQDTGSEAGSLALLAYLLDELYKIAVRRGDNRLLYSDYEVLGGVTKAIGRRAEDTFNGISGTAEEKERLLGQVFRELVTVDERGTATRHPAKPERFGAGEMALVEAFTQARLLVKDKEQVDVAHEALFRSWERLRQWLVEAQEDLVLRRQVENAAGEWGNKGKPEEWLWGQERLEPVYAMRERLNWSPTTVEEAFIERETTRLLRRIEDPVTSHVLREEASYKLGKLGDPRRYLGLGNDGLPEIDWLAVAPGGKLKIANESFKVEGFYISRYLITYPQYEVFVKAGDGYENLEWWAGMPKEYQKQKLWTATNKLGNYPRDTVSWYQAVAYTRWLNKRMVGIELGALGNTKGLLGGGTRQGKPLVIGKNAKIRLPTEWEWQWAAQGGEEGREYPWGAWKEGYANTDEAALGRATAVGMYPQGAAVCGAMDMSGNVWEWCQNKYQKPSEVAVDVSNDWRVVRGGSFNYSLVVASCVYRDGNDPDVGYGGFGFRVVVCSANAPL